MELFSEVSDINIEFIGVFPDGITSPYIIHQVCTRYWCTTVFDQIFKDIKFLDCEIDLYSCFGDGSILQCNTDIIIDKLITGGRSTI